MNIKQTFFTYSFGCRVNQNLGRTSTVLFLNNNIDGFQEALLDNQLPICIKVAKPIQPARLYEAKILEYKKGRLFGKIIKMRA